MAKTALTLLQDQIEAIRREAYTTGYAAAMQAVRDFAVRPAAAAFPTRQPRQPKSAAPAIQRRGRRPAATRVVPGSAGRRPSRGTNAQLIAEALKALPSSRRPRGRHPQGPARQQGGIDSLHPRSVRHGLNQLKDRKEVEASADGKTWHYVGASS